MRRLVYASLAMAAVFCCLNKGLAANPEAPRLEMREPSFDFKEAFEGEKISHDFVFKNSGNAVLSIHEVRTGWGCAVAHFDRAIPPGGEGKITLTVDLRGYNGDFRKDTTVTSNDPEKSSFALTVKGTVKPLFQVRPGSNITFKGIGDQVKDVTLEISTMSQPFRIEKVESNLEGKVSYHLETVAEGQLYRLKVANLLKEGTYNGILKLITDLPRKSDVVIRVSARIEGEVAVRPKSIVLGKLPSQDSVASRNVVVLSNRKKPFKITKLEYDDKLIRVVAKQLPDKPGFDLEISTNVQSLPSGNPLETILTVQTDLDPEAEHKVEVRLYNYQQ